MCYFERLLQRPLDQPIHPHIEDSRSEIAVAVGGKKHSFDSITLPGLKIRPAHFLDQRFATARLKMSRNPAFSAKDDDRVAGRVIAARRKDFWLGSEKTSCLNK